MKEILSNKLDNVSGGWTDRDGSGHQSATNGGSRPGSSNTGGNSGNCGAQSFLSQNSPYGSGSGSKGFFGNSTQNNTGNGYSGSGTGRHSNGRNANDNH